MWAYNDEHEYAVKNSMAKDIEEKIEEHFEYEGKLTRNDKGSVNYTIEGDLKYYVNDMWDNTEDVFEFHPDYTNETLEGVLYDYDGARYHGVTTIPDILFRILMEEEYVFWDYCEGKKGECLEAETKWFEGYWDPNIDINQSLSDRLTELTYEPTYNHTRR